MPPSPNSAADAAWRDAIVEHLARHPDRPLKTRAVARELNITDADYTRFRTFVRQLVADGVLAHGPGRTLRLPAQSGLIVGTFRLNPRGFGFIERIGEADLYVSRRDTSGAVDGDTVNARVVRGRGRGRAAGSRAEVVRVLERAQPHWVGVLSRVGREWIVRPQGREPLPPVVVQNVRASRARAGDLVLVEPARSGAGPAGVPGTIIDRLGDPDDARVQIEGIVRRFALPDAFPGDVAQEAERAVETFDPDDLNGRLDLRELSTVTIDPPDAKDFDDAISIETLDRGRMRLGVHIADVSHFVAAGEAVDREACRRGTSVYFPGRVLPMLPEELSNNVCSLRPDETRYAKSVFLTYDLRGNVLDVRIERSAIRSNARLTYQQVMAVLDGGEADTASDVVDLLKRARDLARIIRKRRLANGMIALQLPETAIHVDEQGHVADTGPAFTSFTNTIIEMFMVEANEAVSRFLSDAGVGHLRRRHAPPESEDTDALLALAPILGQRPDLSLERRAILRLLDKVRGRPEESAVNYVLLRALPQAEYSSTPGGHFALASDHYCHFTSPIRRYPDLTIHRLLDELLSDSAADDQKRELSDDDLAALGRQTSAAERRALQAGREATSALLLMRMRRSLGEIFDGIVAGVASFGVFVQLPETMAEGLVRVGDLGPDEWEFDRKTRTFTGRGTQRCVFIGLRVRVLVAAIDLMRMQIVLVPAEGGPLGVTRSGAPGVRQRSRGRGRRRRQV